MDITEYKILIIDTLDNERVLAEERIEKGSAVLQYNGSDDKYAVLMTSEFGFSVSVPGAADGAFFHLYTGNDTRYRCELHDRDDNLLWRGFLMPDQYSEPYKQVHLFVAMNATDGIGRLKGKYLPNEYYNKETSVIKLIAECLKLTGLSQSLYFAPAVLPAAVNYRWDEIVIDGSQYRDDAPPATGLGPGKAPKRDNAYEILERLVKNIGCTLHTWAGAWYITGINRKHETASAAELYDADGVYQSAATVNRPAHVVTLKATPPQVSIVSPWKNVKITWAIDEDGNLLPEFPITEADDKYSISTGNAIVDGFNHGLPTQAPLMHWQKFGGINVGVGSREGKMQLDFSSGSSFVVPYSIGPYNLQVGKAYTNAFGQVVSGETEAGTATNWLQLKNPKYIKTSDAYIARFMNFKIALFAQGGSQELIDENTLQDAFRCDIMVGDAVLVSNRPGQPGEANFKFELDFRERSQEITEENPNNFNVIVITLSQTSGDIDKEFIKAVQNGYANIRLYAPVCPDPEEAPFYEYVITDLEFEYTAQDEWYDELQRDIDFTTVYELDLYHGDSIQDLSKKQFRFRRWIPLAVDLQINVLAAYDVPGFIHTFQFAVSYHQAQAIMLNPAKLFVFFESESYAVNALYDNPSAAYGVSWSVYQDGAGVWRVSLIVNEAHQSGIFSDIANFDNFFIDNDGVPPVAGWVPENNEWRESWKRYGHDESLRFGLALGRVYHDVQATPLVRLEGEALKLWNPNELLQFAWRGMKTFVPVRLTMNFSEGVTNATLFEAAINNVDDYINEIWIEG